MGKWGGGVFFEPLDVNPSGSKWGLLLAPRVNLHYIAGKHFAISYPVFSAKTGKPDHPTTSIDHGAL